MFHFETIFTMLTTPITIWHFFKFLRLRFKSPGWSIAFYVWDQFFICFRSHVKNTEDTLCPVPIKSVRKIRFHDLKVVVSKGHFCKKSRKMRLSKNLPEIQTNDYNLFCSVLDACFNENILVNMCWPPCCLNRFLG